MLKVSNFIQDNCNKSGFKIQNKLTDKKSAYLQIIGRPGAKLFYDNYIIPNSTWSEARNHLEQDILKKRSEIKIETQIAIAKQQHQEQENKVRLESEMLELQDLKAQINKNRELELNNKKLANTIRVEKNEIKTKEKAELPTKSNPSTTITTNKSSSYREGQSTFYVKKDNIFCLTEVQFDLQIDLLAQNIMQPANYCYLTAYNVDVIMLDYGMLGKTKVRSIDGETIMWVTTESIGQR